MIGEKILKISMMVKIEKDEQPVIISVSNSEKRLLTDELKETYIILENGISKVELEQSDATFLMEQLNEIKKKKK